MSAPASTPLDPSARLFLDRLDAIDEITTKHPIFLIHHPDDDPWDGVEPPLRRCCFTTVPNPIITTDSHKARIREIARRNKQLVDSLPNKLSVATFFLPMIPAILRLLVQLTRPLLWLYSIFKTISWGLLLGLSDGAKFQEAGLWFMIHLALFAFVSYTVFHDEMISREFGWQTEVKAGIYYNAKDPLITTIAAKNQYFNGQIQYTDIATPFFPTGDLRTAVPFACYAPPDLEYVRRWVANPDGEAIAFDIAFPIRTNPATGLQERYHDPSKVCHIVLFGLNGGSNEPYILDFAGRMNARGHTTICMITRGFMGTPIVNSQFFDGSRTGPGSDLSQLIKSVHVALGNSIQPDLIPTGQAPGAIEELERKTQLKQDCQYSLSTVFTHDVMNRKSSIKNGYWTTPIVTTGWSMGGVIVSSYAVANGPSTGLLACACLASSADAIRNLSYDYSRRTWQSFLTIAALINILIPQQHLLAPGGGGKRPISVDDLAKTNSIIDFDSNFTVRFHGHKNVEAYYEKLSFARHENFLELDVPTLIMHADDDPVISIDVNAPVVEALQAGNLKNALVLVTRGGGHLGFPTTMNPFEARWEYPVNCVHNFSEELVGAQFQSHLV